MQTFCLCESFLMHLNITSKPLQWRPLLFSLIHLWRKPVCISTSMVILSYCNTERKLLVKQFPGVFCQNNEDHLCWLLSFLFCSGKLHCFGFSNSEGEKQFSKRCTQMLQWRYNWQRCQDEDAALKNGAHQRELILNCKRCRQGEMKRRVHRGLLHVCPQPEGTPILLKVLGDMNVSTPCVMSNYSEVQLPFKLQALILT